MGSARARPSCDQWTAYAQACDAPIYVLETNMYTPIIHQHYKRNKTHTNTHVVMIKAKIATDGLTTKHQMHVGTALYPEQKSPLISTRVPQRWVGP